MTSLPAPWTPVPVDDVTYAFPAEIRHLMPSAEDIEEHKTEDHEEWHDFVEKLFFSGSQQVAFVYREGIDPQCAYRHLYSLLRSFQPSHEDKMNAAAFLLSQWLTDVLDAASFRSEEPVSVVFDESRVPL